MTFNFIKADPEGVEETLDFEDCTNLQKLQRDYKSVHMSSRNVRLCVVVQACVCPYLASASLC